MSYRWAILAAGTAAQASVATIFVSGLPVLAPTLREEYGLSIGQVGILLAAAWVGSMVSVLAWGLAADRHGERIVLVLGLSGCAVSLTSAAYARSFVPLIATLALAGATGVSVNAASGRAVMQWFAANERGLALGIRQTAIPIGGLVGALAVPPIAAAGGSQAAFVFLATLVAAAALVGALVLRRRNHTDDGGVASSVAQTLLDTRLWRVSFGSSIYVYAQIAVIGFGVLFLHDERGFSDAEAALVVAASQMLAGGFRIGAGRWSDVLEARIVPLRRVGLAVAVSLLVTAGLADGSVWLLVPALTLAGGLSMAWNGLAFTAAAELAGARRSGAAIGFHQTVVSGLGVAAPIAFAASVGGMSWRAAYLLAAVFPLVGSLALRPLREC